MRIKKSGAGNLVQRQGKADGLHDVVKRRVARVRGVRAVHGGDDGVSHGGVQRKTEGGRRTVRGGLLGVPGREGRGEAGGGRAAGVLLPGRG